ncbi:GNAT family N-acetyltransferase [Streptomyces sp. NPDC049906]|uniref:GNAT family N-acetyltransferase n=1 Tax=Streptomyces sp. NPDC049906 TaxID=3155656 RepID=UPI003436E2A3
MSIVVRPFEPADAEGYALVRRAALPFLLVTAESVAFHFAEAHPDMHYRPLVAERNGEVIGTAQVGVAHEASRPGQGFANVHVHPDHRGLGAGTLLSRAAEEHLVEVGAEAAYAWVVDEPGHRAFAERRGYRPGRSARFLRLDLAALPAPLPLPDGVELRTAEDFADDPRPVFALDAGCAADEPGDVDAGFADYAQWLRETWNHPLLNRELTTIAVVDGEPVAFTAARTDGTASYLTGMTGTARAHRGRGLASLVKSDSLHRARAAGLTEAFTGNDAGNAPMLAVNARLGYADCGGEVRCVRELG